MVELNRHHVLIATKLVDFGEKGGKGGEKKPGRPTRSYRI